MENLKTNEGELTSTMGNLLSTSKDDKNEASDSTPTSSTDAFTTTTTSQIAADDPISSTSSDVLESKRSTEKVNDVAHSSTYVISDCPVISSLKDMTTRDGTSPIVSEKDLIDMNITDTSTEKITENVDDIVQDLENLLGEPTESFDFSIRLKDSRNASNVSQNKDISVDIDAFSAELQMLGEQSTTPKEVPKTSVEPTQKNIDHESENANEEHNIENLSTNAAETLTTEQTTVIPEIESPKSESQNTKVLVGTDYIKADTIEKFSSEHIENCQFEIISANNANTEVISVEKSELSEIQDVTSTHSQSVALKSDPNASAPAVEANNQDVQEIQDMSKYQEPIEEISECVKEFNNSENGAASSENPNMEKTKFFVSNDEIFDEDKKNVNIEETGSENMEESVVSAVNMSEETCSENMAESAVFVGDGGRQEFVVKEPELKNVGVEKALNLIENCEKEEQQTAQPFTEPVPEQLTEPVIESTSEQIQTCQELINEKVEVFPIEAPKPKELEMQSQVELTKVVEFESTEGVDSSVNSKDTAESQELESVMRRPHDIIMETDESPKVVTNNTMETCNQKMLEVGEVGNMILKTPTASVEKLHFDKKVEVGELLENKPEVSATIGETLISELPDTEEAKMEVDEAVVEETEGEGIVVSTISETTVSSKSPDIKEAQIDVTDTLIEETKKEVTDTLDKETEKEETIDASMAETTFREDEIATEMPSVISVAINQQVEAVLPSVLEETKVINSQNVSLPSNSKEDSILVEVQVSIKDSDIQEIPKGSESLKEDVRESECEQKQLCEEIQEKSEFLSCDGNKAIKNLEEQTDTQTFVEIPEPAETTTTDDASVLQTFEQSKTHHYVESCDENNKTLENTALSISVAIEDSKCVENVEILPTETAIEGTNTIDTDVEDASNIAPVDFMTENLEMTSHTLAADLDLLVQNAVSDEPISSVLSPAQTHAHFDEKSSELAPTSIDTLKNIEEGIIENNVLPLAMDDVSDLDVLNAISTLSDNKSNLIPEMEQDVQENDALLSSSTLEQSVATDVSFESNIETTLPTVDEIFAEPSQQSQEELQDDNLETLLAVASLQNVDYSIPPVEDFTPSIEHDSNFIPEELAPPPIQELSSFVPVEEPKIDESVQSLLKAQESSINTKSPEIIRHAKVTNKIETGGVRHECEPVVHNIERLTHNVETVKYDVKEVMHQQPENKLKEPLVINIDDTDKDRIYSPKITIKPIKPPEEEVEVIASGSGECESKGSLKMTITKQSDNTHSILKIYDPNDDSTNQEDQSQPEPSVPKLIIKPIVQPNEQPQSPKMSTRSSKVFSPSSSQRSASPRITIKPIPKPDESVAPLKITIKPVLKTDESHKQKHSPKLTIKPIIKPEEDSGVDSKVHSPRVTIKPIVKPEEIEQVSSPRITIKPIVKPTETVSEFTSTTPRVTIKPVVKPSEKERNLEIIEQVERSSPKITIKPIMKPQEPEPPPYEEYEESVKERIVLKINKGTIPGSSKELRKRELIPLEEEKSEKLAKIKLKFSKEGGHPQIVQDQSSTKRAAEQLDHDKSKRQRIDTEQFLPGVTITPIGPGAHSKLKEMLSRNDFSTNKVLTIDDDDDEVTIVEEPCKSSPIVISEESNQDSMNAAVEARDPISEIPVFEITPESVKTLNPQPIAPVVEVPAVLPAPRKRGRPRKVPLQVREDFKDPKEEEPKPVVIESTRPKRSCRGQSVRTTLGIKPRKPRGPGRGRGSKRGMGTRSTPTPSETPIKSAKEPKLSGAKLKELKEESFLLNDKSEVKTIEIDDGLQKSPSNSLLAPPQSDTSTTDRADIVMYEEETRMSAEISSRAQTPAKQVVTSIPTVDLVEESQSSVQSIQSTATTESVKVRKGPRLEVHQEPEGAVISADQLAEYFWMGGGPYMLQEQVAQFLGIKSFKRKYPNIPRRVVDMQERDFIRESGLAGEAMCDLGLTAVNSSDILDIMYSDFQDKYEEYCKHQRDRQAKDLINKQKALTLAASQEKAKMDITQQAVQSAANWNATFNKARRDQRKSCMDLQTLTIHFPKGKMKQINKPKIGYYPVALVPGQFTDYYREFTPTEINNLPLNTLCYDPVIRGAHQEMECDSQTDGSGSESDSSTSDSDSSYSGSSDAEDCTLCKPTVKRIAAAQ